MARQPLIDERRNRKDPQSKYIEDALSEAMTEDDMPKSSAPDKSPRPKETSTLFRTSQRLFQRQLEENQVANELRRQNEKDEDGWRSVVVWAQQLAAVTSIRMDKFK